MKLSVIIVNYNVKLYLEQCLNSVERAAQGLEYEIFVTDNNSTDGSMEYLKQRFPHVTFIENKDNVGFAKANNQAIRIAKGEYVLLLNPDTIVCESTLKDCIQFMDSHQDVGATGVRQLKSNGSFALESRRGIPTPFTSFCKMTGLCMMFPKSRLFGKYYMQYLNANEPNEIEAISGAFMFIRHTTLNESGLLDEDFFMYGEDIDLSFRLMKTGKKNYYLPTKILHYKGESTEKTSYRYIYVFYEAMLIFFRKHYSHYSILLSAPIKAAIYFKAFTAFIAQQTRKLFKKNDKNVRHDQQTSFLIISNNEGTKSIKAILDKCGMRSDIMDGTKEDAIKKGHTLTAKHKDYDYVVYDTDMFAYDDILNFFIESCMWKNPPKLATYSASSNAVITEEGIFS